MAKKLLMPMMDFISLIHLLDDLVQIQFLTNSPGYDEYSRMGIKCGGAADRTDKTLKLS